MKKKIWILALIVLCGAALLASCAKTDEHAAAKKFLITFYTSDLQERYTTLTKLAEKDPTLLETGMEEYYAVMAALCSEELTERLKANRLPYKYDEQAAAMGWALYVDSVELTEDENGDLAYTVIMKDGNHDDAEYRASGSIRQEQADGQSVVTAFRESGWEMPSEAG